MGHNKKHKGLRLLNLLLVITFLLLKGGYSPVFSYCESGCTIYLCGHPKCNTCSFCPPPGSQSIGKFKGLGPLGEIVEKITPSKDIKTPIDLLNKVVSIAIGFITLAAFLYFMFQFFTAGLSWVTAGGDQKKIESAGNKITNGIIGMVIVISAIFVIDLLGKVLGIDILNPFEFITKIWSP